MSEQMTPAELRETAKRLRKRLEISGGTYGDRSDLRAGADALDRLARIVEHVEAVDPTEISTYVLAIARGDTANHENRSER